MGTKLVRVDFKEINYYTAVLEVPEDIDQPDLVDYIHQTEEEFWQVARSYDELETVLDETADVVGAESDQLRETGNFITWVTP